MIANGVTSAAIASACVCLLPAGATGESLIAAVASGHGLTSAATASACVCLLPAAPSPGESSTAPVRSAILQPHRQTNLC